MVDVSETTREGTTVPIGGGSWAGTLTETVTLQVSARGLEPFRKLTWTDEVGETDAVLFARGGTRPQGVPCAPCTSRPVGLFGEILGDYSPNTLWGKHTTNADDPKPLR